MDKELKNFSGNTINCYLGCMKNFALHFGRSPAEMGDDEIRQYLYCLMKEKEASSRLIHLSPELDNSYDIF